METTIISIATSLGCVLLVSVLWSVLSWVWLKPKRLEKSLREQGFQGNCYRLLHGDTKDRARMKIESRSKPMLHLSNDHLPRVLPFFHHTVNKYGRRCFLWNGPVPLVTITEPELIREVFMNINEFSKAQTNPLVKKIATGIFMLEGNVWAQRRKLLNPAFHVDKLKLMVPAMWESSHGMIKEWEEMVSKTGSSEIEVWSYLHKLSADMISRAAFGSSYQEGRRIFELITQQLQIAIPVLNSVYIPGLRFFPTKTNRKISETEKEIRALFEGIIDKRKKKISEGEKPKDDLLGILLDSSFQQTQGDNKKKHIELTFEEVVNECKAFYLAGQDTTSTLLVWTLILLGKHQDWQGRAREEIMNTFGNHNPDFNGLNHLKTVNMILQEVLRLYPPAVETHRSVEKDVKIGDVFLPAGVLANIPILFIQQDEKIWGDDAKKFNPQRFSEGISKACSGNMSFFSFGWGPRICIGSNFAMTQAKMTLALILQRFSFELSPSYAHAPSSIGTLRPQFGAQLIFHKL